MEKEYNARGEKVYTCAINRENAKKEKKIKNKNKQDGKQKSGWGGIFLTRPWPGIWTSHECSAGGNGMILCPKEGGSGKKKTKN